MAEEQAAPKPECKGKEKVIGRVKYGNLLTYEFESLKNKRKKGDKKVD